MGKISAAHIMPHRSNTMRILFFIIYVQQKVLTR